MVFDRSHSRQVAPAVYRRLKTWAARKPCVALMGEFSAGKSTLLNFLIEAELLPTRVTATELPPIWFSHGTEGSHWVDQNGAKHPIAARDLNTVPISARYARVYIEAEILEACDVIDTPGISDPNLAAESWRVAAGFANMVLWCTTATQAWRESERGTWLSMPERLRENSLLVVTRSDKLTSETDREKVARRLQREAGALFSDIVFISSMDAVKAKIELEAGAESSLWSDSGAERLLDSLAARFEAIGEKRHALFARYSVSRRDRGQLLRMEHSAADEAGEDGFVTPIRPARVARPEGQTRSERPVTPLRPAPETAFDFREHTEIAAGPATIDPGADAEVPEEVTDAAFAAPQAAAPVPTEEPLPVLAGKPQSAALRVPHEVAIWREIVGKAAAEPKPAELVSMIEQLLFRLYGPQSAAIDDGAGTEEPAAVPKPDAAEAAPKAGVNETPAKGWRRLA